MEKEMNIKRLIILFIAIFYISVQTSPVFAERPTDVIKSTIDAVIETMNDKSLAEPSKKEERRGKIRALIKKRFNYLEMSKRSLARHWKKRSKEEKIEFVNIFTELLEESYIGKIESYTSEKVSYGEEKIKGKGKYALVPTTIITKDVDIPIDYKLIFKKNRWTVYDVVIEGVSFISTYRSQYDRAIKKDSYSGLIKSMREKLEEIKKTDGEKISDDLARSTGNNQ